MFEELKKHIVGSPMERLARSLYIRLGPSPASRYDRLTLRIMRRLLQSDSNCLDIGAHRGAILAEILRLAPQGNHYAFEPVPEHCRYLAATFPSVQVSQMALSNIRRQTTFVHNRSHPTRSGFMQVALGEDEIETIVVQTDLLDDVIPLTSPVHFIKLDVEGAEYQVLQGGINTLRKNKPIVVFEHTHLAEECYGVSPEAMYDLVTKDCGLRVSLPEDWLQHKVTLGREAFQVEVLQTKSLYFVAHP